MTTLYNIRAMAAVALFGVVIAGALGLGDQARYVGMGIGAIIGLLFFRK